MLTSMQKAALADAVALCGGQAALARLLSRAAGRPVSQQRIWNALHRDQSIPAEWCVAIERATGGRVSRQALRPDLYPTDFNSKENSHE
jgi:DNA-binding transcriptional regulator YdaS (Cro superfamily)